jgi:hypothetical protein
MPIRTAISRLAAAAPLSALLLGILAEPAFAKAKPAGGAPPAEAIGATAGALAATAALFTVGYLHRSGRTQLLRRFANWVAELSSLPPWAGLPTIMASLALVTALFGMYWDISLHIDNGRDPGPLANPAHYFILVGLFGIFAAGFLAVVLPDERPSAVAVKLGEDWYAPLGGVVLLATSSFALAGFPLDDMWHRLFGQDVTLWGPTHLMLIGGAGVSLIGHAILIVEGGRQSGGWKRPAPLEFLHRTRMAAVCGGLLIGLSTFQGEFDFGVPQFRLVLQPLLIATAAGVALVAARIFAGRGGALVAVGYFIAIRGVVSLLVGPVAGETLPHFPIWIAEALIVELVALGIPTNRPYRLGALAGLGIGTLGVAAEWGWSHVWMPNPWPGAMLDELLPLAPIVGVAAGLVGGFLGTCITIPRRPELRPPAAAPALAGALAIAVVVGLCVHVDNDTGVRAQMQTRQLPGGKVEVTARIDPPSAARHANWNQALAWQYKRPLELAAMKRVGNGVYRTVKPLPATGDGKTVLRLHRDASLLSAPVYMPADPGIPVKGVPVRSSVTRDFVYDHELLQRERKKDVPGWVPTMAYSVVGAVVAVFLAILGWALMRLGRGFETPKPTRPKRRSEMIAV